MKRRILRTFHVAAALLVVLPARLPAPTSTRVGVGDLDGTLNRELGVRADWAACCPVRDGHVEITEGQPIPAQVTVPARLAARGVPSPKAGEAVAITWRGDDRWLVRHEASGKQFEWRWKIPPVQLPAMPGCSPRGSGNDQAGGAGFICQSSPEEMADWFEAALKRNGFTVKRSPHKSSLVKMILFTATRGALQVSANFTINARGENAGGFTWQTRR